jgi:hypothetical protein
MLQQIFTVLNLTPHQVNIVRESQTVQSRRGKIRIQDDFTPADILASYKPAPQPLSISDVGMGIKCESVPFYTPIASANASLILDYSMLEEYDVVIVSQKCANFINARVPLVGNGVTPSSFPMDPITLDRFYIPYGIVEGPDWKPIGALGLQKVTAYLPLTFYAQALQQGRKVSLPGLCVACGLYAAKPDFERRMICLQDGNQTENALRIANQYIAQRGYTQYKEMAPAAY